MKITIDLIINAGTHLGSNRVQKHIRANVYTKRNGRYILNPYKTVYILKVAFSVIHRISRDGGKIIFFINNPSFVKIIKPIFPESSKNILVTGSWSSGSITNFEGNKSKGAILPALLVTFQTMDARTPLAEAKRRGIPSIAIFDSGDDPLSATYPVPGNTQGLKPFYLYARILIAALSTNSLNISINQ